MLIGATSVKAETLADIAVELEEVKINCEEFKPNLITKFVWREGPTRELLYKKCLDQTADDKLFNKYNDLLIKSENINLLANDIKDVKTRLTFFTLANSLKMYLTNGETEALKLEMIKSAVNSFKEKYGILRDKLDKEIKVVNKNTNNLKKKRNKELVNIIVSSEEELDQKIVETIKYLDFILEDHHAYVEKHNKFFPEIYIEPDKFYKQKLTNKECAFLKLNFEQDWSILKNKLKISCVNESEKNEGSSKSKN